MKKKTVLKKKGMQKTECFNTSLPAATITSSTSLKKRNSATHSYINYIDEDDDDNLYIMKNSNTNPNKYKMKPKIKSANISKPVNNNDSINFDFFDENISFDEEFNFPKSIEPSDIGILSDIRMETRDIQQDTNNNTELDTINNNSSTTSNSNTSFNIVNMIEADDSNDENDCLLVSPWKVFVDVYKPVFTNMFPNESKMEIYRHLRNKWEQFDDDDKKAYIEKANYKNRAVVRLNHIELKKKMKKEKDRKTVSPYSIFVEERHKSLKNEQPELSLIERTTVIANEWKALPINDKRRYTNKAKKETRIMQKRSPDDSDFEEDE